jgi:glycosyltransferase involved in cell wall biosynthesis
MTPPDSPGAAPEIEPVPAGVRRPAWSVMIPAFNCARYLRQTLESVLAQDPGPDQMQIEVVDDCSTKDDPEGVVREVGQGRAAFHRKLKNEGATANFNTCIQRSRGHLVHILHGDDYVLPGFYPRIQEAAERHPEVSLLACRSFVVDEASVILAVTERLRELEAGARLADGFFYHTPVQTPGVVVRRAFYERHGGFLPGLVHTADCEMWARAIGLEGGLVTPEVLACYRSFTSNDSGRLARTAENLNDIKRLNGLFATRYPAFDQRKASYRLSGLAMRQVERFSQSGDSEAANANLNFWKMNAPVKQRLLRVFEKCVRKITS